MIKVGTIDTPNGGVKPESIPPDNYGSHFDGTFYYFWETKEEADNHMASMVSLIEEKHKKQKQIDANTQTLIFKGFIFADLRWSLSENAQINWLGIQTAPQKKFPISLLSQEGVIYQLAFEDRDAFVGTAFDAKNNALQSGSILKIQIDKIETAQEVKDFADPRM